MKNNIKIGIWIGSIFLLLIGLGFLGYYFGFLGFIYNIALPEAFSKFNIILLSVILAIAAFFSPCSFTVMPAYISYYLQGPKVERWQKVVKFGFSAALGVILVNVVIGLVIALLGATTPFAKDPREDIPIILIIRVLVGILIAVLGFLTLTAKGIRIPFIQNFINRKKFGKGIFWYGVFYNGAAIGCTGPILLSLMLYAFVSGAFSTAFFAFLVFALTMGLLMITFTLLIAVFKETLIKKVSGALPRIEKFAGIVMIIVGLMISILTLEGNKIFVDLFFRYLR